MTHSPWWLILSVIHLGLLAALWRYRRSDHPWLIRLMGAQWLSLLARALLAPAGQGGLALVGDPTAEAAGARAVLFGADLLGWAVLALAAQRLARGGFPGRVWWLVGAAVLAGAAVGASGGSTRWPPAWQRLVIYCVVAPLPIAFAAVRLVSHLRDCLRRRITVDILALAIQLVGLRLVLAWVDTLQPGPLVHPAFELLFHTVSMVALFSLYGLSKRTPLARPAQE